MSAVAEVVIAGRACRIGAVYASAIPPAKAADGPRVPRRLVSFDPPSAWPGGLAFAELRPSAPARRRRRRRMSGGGGGRGAGDRIGLDGRFAPQGPASAGATR